MLFCAALLNLQSSHSLFRFQAQAYPIMRRKDQYRQRLTADLTFPRHDEKGLTKSSLLFEAFDALRSEDVVEAIVEPAGVHDPQKPEMSFRLQGCSAVDRK